MPRFTPFAAVITKSCFPTANTSLPGEFAATASRRRRARAPCNSSDSVWIETSVWLNSTLAQIVMTFIAPSSR